MTEKESLSELTKITKAKDEWPERVPFVESFLCCESLELRAKAVWLYGEMGLKHPDKVTAGVPLIAALLDDKEPLLRCRALNALGRIGRADFGLIASYFEKMLILADDEDPEVRLSFIWASENIATTAPQAYSELLPVFEKRLSDENDRVRMEAPEMFRVMGKRLPEMVEPYMAELRQISENDSERVVRIHAAGAIRATEKAKRENGQC